MNKREQLIAIAVSELELMIIKGAQEKGLTDGEYIQMLSKLISQRTTWMIRFERHGNYDTPGGIEA
jgi:hypothetical protein